MEGSFTIVSNEESRISKSFRFADRFFRSFLLFMADLQQFETYYDNKRKKVRET